MPCLKSYFPVELQGNWQQQSQQPLSPQLSSWLFDASSLTKRLKQHSKKFHVEVIGQKVMACSTDDACQDIKVGEQVLVREVVLYCDEQAHIFARTLLPLTSLTGEQRALSELGEQPLGQVIFNNPSLVRKLIETSEFSMDSSVGKLSQILSLESNKTPTNQRLWGRRSLFYIEEKPLLVAEVFLPAALAYT